MQLPTIELNGVLYVIDVRKQELRRNDRPGEKIKFDELKDEGDYFSVKFVKGTDNDTPGNGMYEFGILIECAIPAWALTQQPKEKANKN